MSIKKQTGIQAFIDGKIKGEVTELFFQIVSHDGARRKDAIKFLQALDLAIEEDGWRGRDNQQIQEKKYGRQDNVSI